MRYERDEASSGLGADAHRALRSIYAAPGEHEYWEGLEARIMARVTNGAEEWWSFFGGWTRVGLLAAGVAGLLVGYTAYRSHSEEQRMASLAVMEASESVRAEVETAALVPGTTRDATTRDATLRYVFSR
jgi:hypothetical protein